MSESPSWLAYVGCRTTRERNAQGLGIGVFTMAANGAWQPMQLFKGLRNPSYLCAHPTQPMLYAVHGDCEEISGFTIAPNGRLRRRQEMSTGGRNPVHLAFAPSGRWLLVANYATGNVVSIPVAPDGVLGHVVHSLTLEGQHGPHAQQDGAHPHQICFSPDGRYAFVPDKGLDTVFVLRVLESTGKLEVAGEIRLPPGSGPRHMVFHPGRPLAYVVGELDRTVHLIGCEGAALGSLALASTVPAAVEEGSAAGIVLSSDTRNLFVSNRGHDSVAAFPVSAAGALDDPQWIAAGRTPRFICEAPGASLLVAREDDHSLAVLHDRREPSRGFIDVAQTGSPVCVIFRKAD